MSNRMTFLLVGAYLLLMLTGCDSGAPAYDGDVRDTTNTASQASCLATLNTHPGKAFYQSSDNSCVACHGNNGSSISPIDFTQYQGAEGKTSLANVIDVTMPPTDVSVCSGNTSGDCAFEVADYLLQLNTCLTSEAQNDSDNDTTEETDSKDDSTDDSDSEDMANDDSEDTSENDSDENDSSNDDSDDNSQNCDTQIAAHTGKTFYDDGEINCIACHGVHGKGLSNTALGAIDYSQFMGENALMDMAKYIEDTMPKGANNISKCVGTSSGACAYETADYLLTYKQCQDADGNSETPETNIAPIAEAGTDQNVESNVVVTLNGSASSDTDGSIVSYLWEQVLLTNSTAVTLSSANTVQSQFTAPELQTAEDLVFKLTVTDDKGLIASDTVKIRVAEKLENNLRPTVSAGADQTVVADSLVTLAATANDADGTVQSYSWKKISGDISISLQGATTSTTTFTAPKINEEKTLTFEVTVMDEKGASAIDTVDVTIKQYINNDSCSELNFHAGYAKYNSSTLNCAGCHGAINEGGTGGIIDISKSLASLVAKTHSDMPPSNTSACTGSDEGDCAYDVIDYLIDLKACEPVQGQFANQTFSKIEPMKHLHKLTHSLGGRSPTTIEIGHVRNNGESALSDVVDELMEESAFYDRIKEVYNDMFLMYKRELTGSTLDRSERNFPNMTWYSTIFADGTETGSKTKRTWAGQNTVRSRAQELVQLVNYLTREEKDFREFLTAPYVMANYYGAIGYGASDDDLAKFTPVYTQADIDNGNYDAEAYPYAADMAKDGKYALIYDPNEFQPITVPDKITSGALTVNTWYGRFPDTSTNRGRHRVYQIYLQYLDIDILGLTNVRGDDAIDSDGVPVMENPSCVTCHSVIDPVGSLLKGWGYVNDNFIGTYDSERNYSDTNAFQAGFKGECVVMPGESTTPTAWPVDGVTCSTYEADEMLNGVPNPMRWLGKRIAQEDGFARAQVKRLFEGLFGQEPVRIYSFDYANVSDELKALEAIQSDYFKYWTDVFTNSGYNMKTLIKEMVLSDYYAPAKLSIDTLASDSIGAVNLRTPEMQRRLMMDLYSNLWQFRGDLDYWGITDRAYAYGTLALYYGGIDYELVTKRTKELESIKVAVQTKMSNQSTCDTVSWEFGKDAADRTLFPYVEIGNTDEAKVTQNIQHLFLKMHGRDLDANHQEIQEMLTLWKDIRDTALNAGQSTQYSCVEDGEGNPNQPDSTYTLHAWHSVMSVLMDDFDYLYE